MPSESLKSVPGVYVSLDELVRIGLTATGFSFLPRQPIHSILSGKHASKLRGRGMDFNELKPYRQGDDTKNIDWKATRRTGKAYVRIYNEERDRRVWVIVSQQNSMFFGSDSRVKSVSAAHAATLALFRVINVGDRVGAVIFNDEKFSVFKPQKSRKGVMQILEELVEQNHQLNAKNPKELTPKEKGFENPFYEALKPVLSAAKHDDLIVLITDGSDVDDKVIKQVTKLSAHNDVMALFVYDPMEQQLPSHSSLLFSNALEFLDINTSDNRFKEKYRTFFNEKLKQIEQASRSRAIPLIKITTAKPVLEQIRYELGHAKSLSFRQRQ